MASTHTQSPNWDYGIRVGEFIQADWEYFSYTSVGVAGREQGIDYKGMNGGWTPIAVFGWVGDIVTRSTVDNAWLRRPKATVTNARVSATSAGMTVWEYVVKPGATQEGDQFFSMTSTDESMQEGTDADGASGRWIPIDAGFPIDEFCIQKLWVRRPLNVAEILSDAVSTPKPQVESEGDKLMRFFFPRAK